jgi:AcrR family transcriptional regulator
VALEKKKRARTPAAIQKQRELIINTGRKHFLKFGSQGMSMRALAKELGMGSGKSASSLYTYVKSKRELWFLIMRTDFKTFEDGMSALAQEHQGTQVELLMKIAEFYLKEALADPQRYNMMFNTPAPLSNSVGENEQNYESKSLYFLKVIINQAVEAHEIQEEDVGKMAFLLWGMLHGPISAVNTELFGKNQKLPEYGSKEDFIAFVLDKLEIFLTIL